VLVHERFGTATVAAPGVVFDLAGARRERYERPGALPVVELGASLGEDLARRDFTVNAIALHLADGELTAWPGARDDLEARVLRVLHGGSFLDDPTRLLRLARYAARLGFRADPATDALAAAAVASGAVDTVTAPRLGAELRLLIREPLPEALVALERHGLGAAVLDPAFAVDPALVERAVALTPADARADLAALATTLPGSRDAAARLDALGFPAAERRVIARAAAGASDLAGVLDGDRALIETGEPLTDVDLWRALRSEPAEAVAVAGAVGDAAMATRWLGDVRHRRLQITGDDIVAAGLYGPPVGQALERATEAMLAGRARTREQQLAAALGGGA
jgi:tRNA nucleotidyltransferase (CCA-adding enzyme)